MMINNNSTSIFQGKAMGIPEQIVESPEESFDNSYSNDNLSSILSPVGFENKVMGGQRSSMFFNGKMPGISGAQEYSERLKYLTNQPGGFNMTEVSKSKDLKGFFSNSKNPFDKINMMTKNSSSSNKNLIDNVVKKSGSDVSKFIGGAKLGTINFDMKSMFSASNNKKDFSVNDFFKVNSKNADFMKDFGRGNSKDINKFIGSGVGNRALPGLNVKKEFDMHNKISKAIGFDMSMNKNNAVNKINSAFDATKIKDLFGSSGKKVGPGKTDVSQFFKSNTNTDPSKMFASTGVDINKMFGSFSNPEKVSNKRMKQQKGLSMFGDYDGDKLMNIFDCDPLDPKKQGEQHELTKYMGNKDMVVLGDRDVQSIEKGGALETYDSEEQYESGIPYKMNNDSDDDTNQLRAVPVYDDDAMTRSYGDVAGDVDTFQGFENNNVGGTGGTGAENVSGYYSDDDYEFESPNIGSFDPVNISASTTGPSSATINNDEVDFSIDSQIRRVTIAMETAAPKDKKKYADIIDRLYKTKSRSDAEAYKRSKEEAQKNSDSDIRSRELDFKKQKFAEEFEVGKRDRDLDRVLRMKQFVRQANIDDRNYNLQRAKMRADRQKGELALWENKLKAGSNILGSLIGGGAKPKDMGDITGINKFGGTNLSKGTANIVGNVGGYNISNNTSMLTGMSPGNSAYAIAESIGEAGYRQSFGQKVQESVGDSSRPMSYSQKVGESLGGQSVEEVKRQQAEQRELQARMMQGLQQRPPEQVMQQPIMRQLPNPQIRSPEYSQQMNYNARSVDWDTISPNQAAQFDPGYAEYLKESDAAYRRGPYKKGR